MFLTKSNTFIIGPVAALLGLIMNVIFNVQSSIGIANIGLCIILFTIVIYALMTPLTIQQQKFSKMSAKMNPELQAMKAAMMADVPTIHFPEDDPKYNSAGKYGHVL